MAIYQALQERGIKAEFIINSTDGIESLLKGTKYLAFDWLNEKESLFRKINAADLIIVDSYLAGQSLLKEISLRARKVVYLDDNKRLHYPAGIVINGSVYAGTLRYPRNKKISYLLGTKYAPLRKSFWRLSQKRIHKRVKSVLITFGGDDNERITDKILVFLINRYPELHKNVIIGMVGTHLKRLKKLYGPLVKFVHSPTAEKMKSIMLNADFAICAGGQTLYELARIGVPVIVVTIARNQLNNVIGWQREGFIEYAGARRDRDLFVKLDRKISSIMPQTQRLKKSKIGRSCVDGKGSLRIADKLIKDINYCEKQRDTIKLRRASLRDSYDLWRWRNDSDVRKWCFSNEEISYNRHKDWLANTLGSKDTVIFIAESANRRKLGQVRFNKNGNRTAYINVNLNPLFFGKGLGDKIIREATSVFMKDNPGIEKITAEIINDNVASQKVFERAGYVFLRRIFKKGKRTSIFTFKT